MKKGDSQNIQYISTLLEYCETIHIPPPLHGFFDIRKFEENMKTVNAVQSPFRHEFYAIALRNSGANKEVNGVQLNKNLFFNSPYQIITWNIVPDWQGWYILFGKEFLSMNPQWSNFIIDYPFFRLDQAHPIDIPEEVSFFLNEIFSKIFDEYHSQNEDKVSHIIAYTQILLVTTKRYFETVKFNNSENNRASDILLVSRFQTMLESIYNDENNHSSARSANYYANKLNVHPNYLNAVVKRITSQTVSHHLQRQTITTAKSLLNQTKWSVKEIAYRLGFSEATHFVSYFKKAESITPSQYRDTLPL